MKQFALGLMLVAAAACSSNTRTAMPTPARDTGGTGSTLGAFTTMIRCESMNNDRQTCKVDARDRMVSINQQLSDTACVLGRSWGLSDDRDAIWVNNGCRAEFLVGGAMAMASGSFGRAVICESVNNSRVNCPIDTSYGVQLVRKISDNECVSGRDWGYDENGIWVDRGCRAEFVLGGEQRFTARTTPAGQRITCESQNEGMQRCAADTSYGVTLARQISNSTCVRGQTWGYDSNGIWVNRGCRAEFVLGF